MGHATNLYGIISFPSHPNSQHIWTENKRIITALPDADKEYPAISNKMFSNEFQPGWDTRHIHFAANYKSLEFELQTWVDKFEQLLRSMMWLSADVQIQTDISGDYEIEWVIEKDLLAKWASVEWVPTTQWTSTGLRKKEKHLLTWK